MIFAKVGVPSFVVTLAGLLGWNGVVLLLIGNRGTVSIQDPFVNGIANDNLSHAWAWILAVCVSTPSRSNRQASVPSGSRSMLSVFPPIARSNVGVIMHLATKES